jgi:hypothetical protein
MRRRYMRSVISIPNSKVGQFCLFFGTQFLSYFLFIASARAAAQGSYFWTAVTDSTFAVQAFVVSKVMIDNVEARTVRACVAYTLGGTCGSLASIFATKHLYGH